MFVGIMFSFKKSQKGNFIKECTKILSKLLIYIVFQTSPVKINSLKIK